MTETVLCGGVCAMASEAIGIPESQAVRADAAVLVIDVSGFTALTAQLESEHGRRAPDRLAVVMDDLLGAFADIAMSHGGTVIDVVGDSVQAMWLLDTTGVAADCAARAVHAARAMIVHVDGHSQAPDLRLLARVGVGFGHLNVADVGGHDGVWDRLVWGEPLLEAAQCTALALPSAVIIADSAWPLLEHIFDAKREASGWILTGWKDDAGSRRDEAMVPVGSEGPANISRWAAELRSASILFIRLFRVEELADARHEPIQRRVLLVQTIVAAHGGQLEKIHADEKGISAVVAFGLPPMAIADAASRALGAAAELRAELHDLGLDVAIGVATGKVRAGVAGALAKNRPIIYGGAANLAARCMQACNDEVLCDSSTRKQSVDSFEFFAPEAHSLKGLGDGLSIFGVGNAKRQADRRVSYDTTPIAGRERELAMIERFVTDDAAARVLLLDGEIGVGKSRLAAFSASVAQAGKIAVLNMRAGPLASRTPLFAWRDPAIALLRDWTRKENLRLQETQARLIEAAGENPYLAPLTNPLFGMELTESAANAISDPNGRPRLARRLQAMVLSKLLGEAKQLLIIEDAHWLDEASALLAADLYELNPQIHFLIAGRSPLTTVQTVFAQSGVAGIQHRVEPLTRAGMADLARVMLGTFDSAHPIVNWLHSRTRGNPLFARELLQAMPGDIVRSGLVSAGAWRDADAKLRELDLPQTVEAAAVVRVGAQPLSRLSLLKAASVVGGSFGCDILRALDVPVSADNLERELEALVSEGLLVAEQDRRWRFAQDLVRDTVYGSLPDKMRTDLHRKAVLFLEGLSPAEVRNESAQIAHHWSEAGEPCRALKPLRRAGISAQSAGAYADAIGFFESALAIARSEVGAKLGQFGMAKLNLELCNAYFVVGDHHKAVVPGLESLNGLWRGVPKTNLGWIFMALRETVLLAITIKFPALQARERRSLRARSRNRLRCETATRLSDCYIFMQGSFLPSLALSLYGVRAAEKAGDLSVAAPPYGFIAYTVGLLRLNRLSDFCSSRTIADCQKKKNFFGLQRAYGGKLLLAMSMGDWTVGKPLMESSLAERQNYHSDVNHGMALVISAQFFRWIGDLRASHLRFGELAELGREISDDQFVDWSHIGFGRIALCNGDPTAAEAEFDKGLTVLGRMVEIQALFILEALRALAILRQGRFDEAAALVDPLILRAESTSPQFSSGDAYGAVAEVMNALLARFGGTTKYRSLALRARKRAREFAFIFPIGRPIAALHDGQLAALSGASRKAERIWRQGLKVAEKLPMKYEAARLHGALATLPSLSEGVRAEHRARAAGLLNECGAGELPPLPIEVLL